MYMHLCDSLGVCMYMCLCVYVYEPAMSVFACFCVPVCTYVRRPVSARVCFCTCVRFARLNTIIFSPLPSPYCHRLARRRVHNVTPPANALRGRGRGHGRCCVNTETREAKSSEFLKVGDSFTRRRSLDEETFLLLSLFFSFPTKLGSKNKKVQDIYYISRIATNSSFHPPS